jgi:hypothetical protein
VSPRRAPDPFQKAVARLARQTVARQPAAVADYPFDAQLLARSALYRRSRKLFAEGGGTFRSTLVSSARTLSSAILLENTIEYTPLARELLWAATDPIERRNPATLTSLRKFIPSLFHEQNHRILWKRLPAAPVKPGPLRRYLNFAEALVITADMALADELGPGLASDFKAVGVIYDPGTDVRERAPSKRDYRNYLQACLHATYLNLEVFKPEVIAQVTRALYANAGPLADRAVARAANLNKGFIIQTNLNWQRKHRKAVLKALATGPAARLDLEDDPLNNRQQYMFAEHWFELLGL